MNLLQADLAIRIGAVAVILLLALLLWRGRRQAGMPARLFAPLALCLSGFLIGNTPDPDLKLSGLPGAVASGASGCTVVFLWWFCLACFDREFRPRGPVLIVGIFWLVLAAADRLIDRPTPVLTYGLVALGFGIVAHLLWRLWSEREGDLIQERHNARLTTALLLGALLLGDLLVDLFLGFDWRPRAFAMAQNGTILGFGTWLAIRLLHVRGDVLTFAGAGPDPFARASADDREPNAELRRRLSDLIERDRVHLDPDLTFADFVERMSAPERNVRRLINHELGFDHFRTFLNHHRLQEARRLLRDPGRASDKVIAIAFDSGFASLPSFNRVFRAVEGCTPSEYRERALAVPKAA